MKSGNDLEAIVGLLLASPFIIALWSMALLLGYRVVMQ